MIYNQDSLREYLRTYAAQPNTKIHNSPYFYPTAILLLLQRGILVLLLSYAPIMSLDSFMRDFGSSVYYVRNHSCRYSIGPFKLTRNDGAFSLSPVLQSTSAPHKINIPHHINSRLLRVAGQYTRLGVANFMSKIYRREIVPLKDIAHDWDFELFNYDPEVLYINKDARGIVHEVNLSESARSKIELLMGGGLLLHQLKSGNHLFREITYNKTLCLCYHQDSAMVEHIHNRGVFGNKPGEQSFYIEFGSNKDDFCNNTIDGKPNPNTTGIFSCLPGYLGRMQYFNVGMFDGQAQSHGGGHVKHGIRTVMHFYKSFNCPDEELSTITVPAKFSNICADLSGDISDPTQLYQRLPVPPLPPSPVPVSDSESDSGSDIDSLTVTVSDTVSRFPTRDRFKRDFLMDNKDCGKVYIPASDTAAVSAAIGSTRGIGAKSKTYKTQKPRKHLGAQKAQRTRGKPRKAVVRVNKEGNVIRSFERAPDAEDYYNLPPGSVGRVCRGQQKLIKKGRKGYAIQIFRFRFA